MAIFEDCSSFVERKCTGALVPDIKNIKYDITAKETADTKYSGLKYEIMSYSIAKCSGREDMVALLSSGMFTGIGKSTAGRIYDRFKDQALEIIKDNPIKLLNIKGITIKKAEAIHNAYEDHLMETRLFQYLTPFGFTPQQIRKVQLFAANGDPLDFVKAQPYSLMKIRGVTFEMVDAVAKENGFEETCSERLAAAATQTIKNIMLKGHAGATYQGLNNGLITLLKSKKILPENIKTVMLSLVKSEAIAYRKVRTDAGDITTYYYLPEVLKVEKDLAEEIKSCLARKNNENPALITALLSSVERETAFQLDASQHNAVITALTNNLSIITGGPGTGKTTIIRAITSVWNKLYKKKKDIVLMSPTGKAARRMTETTNIPASTIHSMLKLALSDDNSKITQVEDINIENSLVIIDEVSMLDMFVAEAAFEHIHNCTIVLVGDCDQLPSVGCGKVLDDLIKSGVVPVTKLQYSHRQQEGSGICLNAEKIRKGIDNISSNKDFLVKLWIKNENANRTEVLQMIENKMFEEYKALKLVYDINNIAVLCPFNRGPAGQLSLNRRLQEYNNPSSQSSKEIKISDVTIFRVKDLVMQLVNTDKISNGEVGMVKEIGKEEGRDVLLVEYPSCTVKYSRDELDQITLAYAMTIHKSQGSEYDAVITCLTKYHGPMIRRNVIYTAITRAKKQLILIGTEDAIKQAINNNKIEERNTMLKYDLANHSAENYNLNAGKKDIL